MTEEDIIEFIYNTIDEMLLSDRFDSVDDLLECVDVPHTDTTILLSLLTITLAAKGKLMNRASFYQWVEEYLWKIRPNDCLELLRGLR